MRFLVILLGVVLTGCARDTSITDDVFIDLQKEVGALERDLPKECKTETIISKIGGISAKVELAEKSCNRDIKDCRSEARLWKYRFYGLGVIMLAAIALYLYRKVRKIF